MINRRQTALIKLSQTGIYCKIPYWALLFSWKTFLKSSFRFTTKLRGRHTHFLRIPTQVTSFIINVTHQNGTFLTKDEPISAYNHPKFTLGFTLGVVHSVFGQRHNDISIIIISKSIFIALKIFCALPVHPTPPPLICFLSPYFCLF